MNLIGWVSQAPAETIQHAPARPRDLFSREILQLNASSVGLTLPPGPSEWEHVFRQMVLGEGPTWERWRCFRVGGIFLGGRDRFLS